MDKKRNILICYVFDEFQYVVDEINKQFKYRSLKNYGFSIHSLNDGQARASSPIDESLRAVRSAYYCVGLIGSTLGGRPKESNKTYIQSEISEALSVDNTYLHVWAIGKDYWDGISGDDVNKDVSKYLEKLSEKYTIGTIEDSTPSYIASKILDALERDIADKFSDEDNHPPKDGLLEVSGFNPSSVDIVDYGIGDQLKIIYGNDPLHYSSATLEEYQKLAFEEMRLKNLTGALKSLNRVTDYFDSDIVGNYWSSRLISFHKDNPSEKQIKNAEDSVNKVIAALEGAKSYAPVVMSLCNTTLAKIYQIRSDYKRSNLYIDKARSEYLVYDALQIQTENILDNIDSDFINRKNHLINARKYYRIYIFVKRPTIFF